MRVAQIWTLSGGKAVRFESFQDTHASAKVLGTA
jgi:ketosteroid isomerase-like protein